MFKKTFFSILIISLFTATCFADSIPATNTTQNYQALMQNQKLNHDLLSNLLFSKTIQPEDLIQILQAFVETNSEDGYKLKSNDKQIFIILKKDLHRSEFIQRDPKTTITILQTKLRPLIKTLNHKLKMLALTLGIGICIGFVAYKIYKEQQLQKSLDTTEKQVEYLKHYKPYVWALIQEYRNAKAQLYKTLPGLSQDYLNAAYRLGIRVGQGEDVREELIIANRVYRQTIKNTYFCNLDTPGMLYSEIFRQLPRNITISIIDAIGSNSAEVHPNQPHITDPLNSVD